MTVADHQQRSRGATTVAAAAMSFLGCAAQVAGATATGFAFANLCRGTGILALFLIFWPFGIGLALLGLLQISAAVA